MVLVHLTIHLRGKMYISTVRWIKNLIVISVSANDRLDTLN